MIVNGMRHSGPAERFYQQRGQLEEDRVESGHGMVGHVLQRFLLILALLNNGPDFVPLAQSMVDSAPGNPGF